jgi:hypothetical protein
VSLTSRGLDHEFDLRSNRSVDNNEDQSSLSNYLNPNIFPIPEIQRPISPPRFSIRRITNHGYSRLEDVEDSIELLRRRHDPGSYRAVSNNLLDGTNQENLEITFGENLDRNPLLQSEFLDRGAINQSVGPSLNIFRSEPLIESLEMTEENLGNEEEDLEPQTPDVEPGVIIEEVNPGKVDITDQCAICQEDLNRRHSDSAFVDCMHWYHYVCIKHWVLNKPECPTCKYPTNNIFKIYDENNPLDPEEEIESSKQPEVIQGDGVSGTQTVVREPVSVSQQGSIIEGDSLAPNGSAVDAGVEFDFENM